MGFYVSTHGRRVLITSHGFVGICVMSTSKRYIWCNLWHSIWTVQLFNEKRGSSQLHGHNPLIICEVALMPLVNWTYLFLVFSFWERERERIIVYKYISYSSKIKKPYITFLKSITMLCGIDCVWQNIPHIHVECEEYFVEYNQSHITLLWIWIMLYKNSMRLGGFFIIWHQDWLLNPKLVYLMSFDMKWQQP